MSDHPDILASRKEILTRTIEDGFAQATKQVQGFLSRTLPATVSVSADTASPDNAALSRRLEEAPFGGYPALARIGYTLASLPEESMDSGVACQFLQRIAQQRERPFSTHVQMAGDAIAMLGLADGIAAIARQNGKSIEFNEAADWLRSLVATHGVSDPRLSRAHLLARDLLEGGSRSEIATPSTQALYEAALDLSLSQTWPHRLRLTTPLGVELRRDLFRRFLTEAPPGEDELFFSGIWLTSLEVLTSDYVAATVPDVHSVARILRATQGSFRRWRWEARPARINTAPARWLIDKEADVQGFLLAVLYPYFTDDLQDERFLSSFGLKQGRFDFAVRSLNLIVEVKMLRRSGDISKVETEVAEDLSLYFHPDNPFESMIVYVYDDRDNPQPERYPTIRDALSQRSERILDVVIVPRPSMIPDRNRRRSDDE